MIRHGFAKLAAGSEYQQALSPERQVLICIFAAFCHI